MDDPSLRSTEYLASCSLCLPANVWRLRAALRWPQHFQNRTPRQSDKPGTSKGGARARAGKSAFGAKRHVGPASESARVNAPSAQATADDDLAICIARQVRCK